MKLSPILKTVILLLVILLPVFLILFFNEQIINRIFFRTRNTNTSNVVDSGNGETVEVVAKDLYVPWDIAFLPDKAMLVTQRDGKLLKIDSETKIIEEIEGVEQTSEGGLMGLALHPDFKENQYIYIFMTTQNTSGLMNQIVRYQFDGNKVSDRKIILDGIKGANNHDGGRLRFGPDGYLYATTGDAATEKLAQDKTSLNGKILRITEDGEIPKDNSFNNEVYSYGHRNPQGLAWDSKGRLWQVEHGPSGLQSGNDEINLIKKGSNYGWPDIVGDEKGNGMIQPSLHSGSADTWAPAGAAIADDLLFFTGLRGEALYMAELSNDEKISHIHTYFKSIYGRLRAITVGPDGFLYVSTSNNDGRGTPQDGDDKILKIDPRKL